MDDRQPFGSLLKRHRLAAGLTHEALAERSTLSVRSISDLERGVSRRPHSETVTLLAAALQLAPAQRVAFKAASRPRIAETADAANALHNLPVRQPTFVGRAGELSILRQRFADLRAGQGNLLLIGGDPGIGKTSLVEVALRDPSAVGVLTLVGHCYDRADTPPYGPWIDLFMRYSASQEAPSLPPAFARRGTVGVVQSQLALFAQALEFFTTLATWQPTIVVIEDLHWGDPASLDLLRFLAQSIPSLPLLLLVTYRTTEASSHRLLDDLVPILIREAHPERIELRPLSATDAQAIVETGYRLSRVDVEHLTVYLHARAEGNPLFLGELLRTLEEEGILRSTNGGHALGDPTRLGVPALLRQVIAGRVRRLGDEALALLTWAAIIGHEAPLDLWLTVADAAEEAVLDLMERAVKARVLLATSDGERVRFAHALIRDALYELVLPPRRRGMHRRIAEAVARLPRSDPDVVAFHFVQAGDERAAEWLVRAGEQARDAYAYETAVARFEEALPLLAADPALAATRAAVLLLLARLLRLEASDPELSMRYAEAAMALAAELGDQALTAVAQFRLGTNLCLARRASEGLAAMQSASNALDLLPADATEHLIPLDPRSSVPWQRQAEYALRLAIVGRFAEAGPLAIAARLEGRQRHDGNYNASNALTHVYSAEGRVADALAMFSECQRMTVGVQEYYHSVLSLAYEIARVVIPFCADQPALLEEVTRRAEVWSTRITGPFAGLPLSGVLHGLLFLAGRWDEVEASTPGSYGLQQEHSWVRGRIALMRGETQSAWHIIRPFLPDDPTSEPGDAWFLGTTAGQRLAAELAIADGDLPATRAWLEAHDRWLDWGAAVLGRADATTLWAQYYRAAGDSARAQTLAEKSLTFATEPRQPLALVAAQRLLGELLTDAGRHAEAEFHLHEALTIAEACAALFERARCLLALAELRAATGQSAEARRLAEEVCALCTPLAAAPTMDRSTALLADLDRRPRVASYPAGLTAREVEVLRLVAQGLTDAEVAARLYLSRRTVGSHLTAIYTKLAVNSRIDATREAVQRGIVSP